MYPVMCWYIAAEKAEVQGSQGPTSKSTADVSRDKSRGSRTPPPRWDFTGGPQPRSGVLTCFEECYREGSGEEETDELEDEDFGSVDSSMMGLVQCISGQRAEPVRVLLCKGQAQPIGSAHLLLSTIHLP